MHLATIHESRTEKVHQARDSLDAHLKELAAQMEQGRSENMVRYLEACAQFHAYSFGNLMLALAQCPQMTRIAGIRTWNKLGRHVRAGEKGIMILAPIEVTRKAKDKQAATINADPDEEATEEETDGRRRATLFKPVYVFDVSQTEGEELPSLIHAAGEVSAICPALEKAIRDAGITLEYADHVPGCPGAEGASYKGRVVIREALAAPDRFRTLAHEYAHEILHDHSAESRTVKETEADAAAFVVCRHFGVQCDTADYLLLYNSEPKILLDRLETIRRTAARIIDAIEDVSSRNGEKALATLSEEGGYGQ